MTINNWPKNERPREKLLQYGANRLSNAELLAICLRCGIKGKSVLDLSRELLQSMGSLRNLFECSPQQFQQHPGLSCNKYAELQAALEISRRYLAEDLQDRDVLSNSVLTRHFLCARLRHYQHEVFACLFLDSKHRMISFDELAHGTVDCTHIHTREVVKLALARNAAAVILAHNHPSGDPTPSPADIQLTHDLKHTLGLIDIRVLDHIVVGAGQTTSLAELGEI